MIDLKPENRAFYWAHAFLRALWQQGLKHVIISPGSRSTPLTLAAAALPDLEKHVILDERSAAFMALGIGKATHQPVALICTSGTAVANYFPAVIEARMSGVPMLLLTADRPPHLRNTGANQSINQQHIFGDYPVHFQDMGEPSMDEKAIENWRETAGQAFSFTQSRKGPVHLNFPFSKPLEPDKDFIQSVIEDDKNQDQKLPSKFPKSDIKSFRFDDDLLYEIHTSERPIIVTGQLATDTPLKHLFWLAKWLEAPVLSEQGIINPDYAIQGFEGFLRDEANYRALEPDLILRFGQEPASKSLLLALKNWKPNRHIHFSDHNSPSNVSHTTTDFIEWDGKYFDANKFPEKSDVWLQSWKQMETHYFKQCSAILDEEEKLGDGHVYHHLVPKIPEDWSVSISNSFPARDRSMFGRWKTQPIFTNRGASGIDGITSTAMGVTIGLHQSGILFTGDLAFLHDTNALLNAKELRHPLVVVVINNQGGSIFRMLPVAGHDAYFKPYFETPQQVDISALAKSYDLNYIGVESIANLAQLDLDEMTSTHDNKLHIIECRTDPETSMNVRNILWGTTL